MTETEAEMNCSPLRIFLTEEEMASFDKEQLIGQWCRQESYINWLESQLSAHAHDGKLKPTLPTGVDRRESLLLMRLNSKEQEAQDLLVQIQEFKTAHLSSSVSLRSCLLDPAVNLLVQHLHRELEKAKTALEESQNELSAWKFTPDSNTGKRLMAKCRLLYQENEELGRMLSSGRMAKLEGDLALQRNFSEEMKKSQSELDEFLLELDEDVEGMQSTIYFLQQQLRQARDQLAALQKENDLLRSSHCKGNDGFSHCNCARNDSASNSETKLEKFDTEQFSPLIAVENVAGNCRPSLLDSVAGKIDCSGIATQNSFASHGGSCDCTSNRSKNEVHGTGKIVCGGSVEVASTVLDAASSAPAGIPKAHPNDEILKRDHTTNCDQSGSLSESTCQSKLARMVENSQQADSGVKVPDSGEAGTTSKEGV